MSDETKYFGVLSGDVNQIWDSIKPMMDKAIKYADWKYDVEDIKQDIINRNLQLWVATMEDKPVMCLVTRIEQFPKEKAMLLFMYSTMPHSGKDREGIWGFKDIIFSWAKSMGCKSIYFYGRPGWEKVLDSRGFKKIYTVMRREI